MSETSTLNRQSTATRSATPSVEAPSAVAGHLSAAAASRLSTPNDLKAAGRVKVGAGLTRLLADFFALYTKTKNFHWHVSGPHFRDYHLMFDEQGTQLYAATDPIGERARKLGAPTLHSIGQIAALQRIEDNDAEYVPPKEMLSILRQDNLLLVEYMRALHDECGECNDVATASLLENWIDEAETRAWFLFEASRS